MQTNGFRTDAALRLRAANVVLLVVTGAILAIWYGILKPFLPVLSWSLALTVIAFPVYSWLQDRIRNKNVAAGVAVALLALVVVGPLTLVAHELVRAVVDNVQALASYFEESKWRELLESRPRPAAALAWLDENFNLRGGAQELFNKVRDSVPTFFASSLWSLVGLLLLLFTSFFFFRDRRLVLDTVREFVPLSSSETDEIFLQIKDTVYATLYGTLVVACVQGLLGGLMFWWLGLTAPVLWGAVMAILALIPYLGAFLVWMPAALFLALSGSLGKAVVLAVWGAIVIALIDNLLYPVLVGKRLRFHTLAVFFFILGGLQFFGASGLVLGPMALAVGNGLIDIWKRRLRTRPLS